MLKVLTLVFALQAPAGDSIAAAVVRAIDTVAVAPGRVSLASRTIHVDVAGAARAAQVPTEVLEPVVSQRGWRSFDDAARAACTRSGRDCYDPGAAYVRLSRVGYTKDNELTVEGVVLYRTGAPDPNGRVPAQVRGVASRTFIVLLARSGGTWVVREVATTQPG